MGAWHYVQPRFNTAARELCCETQNEPRLLRFVGRPSSASTATASFKIHQKENNEIFNEALTI